MFVLSRIKNVRRKLRTSRGDDLGPYKDAKLFRGGSREWNWPQTGTEYVPGIQPANVQELLDHGANVVVLLRGMAECLRVPRETIDFLKERRIEALILPATQAAGLYNRLAKEGPVGGCFTQPAGIRGECRSRRHDCGIGLRSC
jgi:hypothetical protein